MKAAELRDKTPEQLREQLEALKKEAFNLRFRRATGQLENTHADAHGAPRRRAGEDGPEREGAAAASEPAASE